MTRTISPQYFSVMGTPLLKGRVFTEADRADSPKVAILNEYWARELFPGRDPIGRTLPSEGQAGAIVVGVVKNSWQTGYDQPARAEVVYPVSPVHLWNVPGDHRGADFGRAAGLSRNAPQRDLGH